MTVFQIDVQKVRQRADFFLVEAGQLCAQARFAQYGFALSDENAMYLSEAYFLVNEAYKERRQNEGHKTQPPKIAAITAAVIGMVNPLRPAAPPQAATKETTYANPLFALRAACTIVDHPIHKRPWEQRMWFCDQTRLDRLECLDSYLELVRAGKRTIGDLFDISLSDADLARIEGRFSFYAVLGDMKVFK